MEKKLATLQTKLAGITDFRKKKGMRYRLVDLLFSAFVAVLCGADDFEAMAMFCRHKKEFLSKFCAFGEKTPSHDTFRQLFASLDNRVFLTTILDWLGAAEALREKVLVNIDGKALRATRTGEHVKSALQVVSAWLSEEGLILGQEQVESKSNEKTAIPILLDSLELRGSMVSIDAMGTHPKIAEKIVERGGDYLLALKKNNKNFYKEVENYFEHLSDIPVIDAGGNRVEKNAGRTEERQVFVSYQTAYFGELTDSWKNIASIIKVVSKRIKNEKESAEARFYISSCKLTAQEAQYYIRRHWSIENELHWYLDVVFKEDKHRIRYKNTTQNMSLIRKLALKVLKDYDGSKESVAHKRLQLAWDDKLLTNILQKFSCVSPVSDSFPPNIA